MKAVVREFTEERLVALPTTEFILYALTFRIVTIATGLACVYMGYRLFVLGVMPREGSDIDAQSDQIRLTIRNAAPGTCFAFFGAAIIIAMVVSGVPNLSTSSTPDDDGEGRVLELRGDEQALESLVNHGQALADAGDLEGAIAAFAGALSDNSMSLRLAKAPLMGLASVYRKQSRLEEAIAYARLVAQSSPDDAQGHALVGWIAKELGNFEEAKSAMKLAARLNPEFEKDLAKLGKLPQ